MRYFETERSAAYRFGKDSYKKIIETIANKYIADNPAEPFVFRAYNTAGIKCGNDGRFRIDFSKIYPNAKKNDFAYAATRIYSSCEGSKGIAVTALGGTEVYVNGELVFKSDHIDEAELGKRNNVIFNVKAGMNDILVKCKKHCDGFFGAIISGNSPKWAPLLFFAPFAEREGQTGFAYSNCVSYDVLSQNVPAKMQSEDFCEELKWFPKNNYCLEESVLSPTARIFGKTEDKYALALSKIIANGNGVEVYGNAKSELKIYIDSKLAILIEAGDFSKKIEITPGEHFITVLGYDYKLNTNAELKIPFGAQGCSGEWLYLGLFSKDYEIDDIEKYHSPYKLFSNGIENIYWRADAPNTVIRPSLESESYGKWSYPHGVTLYGLIRAGELLDRADIKEYVKGHVAEAVSMFSYTMWDKYEYGYPNINQQLSWFSALDDEGSFGSLMIEVFGKDKNSPVYSELIKLADKIADYIMNRLEKTEDGAFYRILGEQRTLWADDLYMSVPFLSRYYELTGEEKYLEMAAKQFILFKKYLLIKDCGVFSHVYDFRRESGSCVPWGRGNGWVIFSLTELLEKMPEKFYMRTELEELFRELIYAWLKLQGENGMWHQVLNDMTTYEETSCTAMMLYALSRGIRFGIIKDENAVAAAKRAWEGLADISVEYHGNVYGVCRGSGYSFDPEYYRNLSWNYNDTHGIGIIMLAGIEFEKMMGFVRGNTNE